jgi:hypothetical protein
MMRGSFHALESIAPDIYILRPRSKCRNQGHFNPLRTDPAVNVSARNFGAAKGVP